MLWPKENEGAVTLLDDGGKARHDEMVELARRVMGKLGTVTY